MMYTRWPDCFISIGFVFLWKWPSCVPSASASWLHVRIIFFAVVLCCNLESGTFTRTWCLCVDKILENKPWVEKMFLLSSVMFMMIVKRRESSAEVGLCNRKWLCFSDHPQHVRCLFYFTVMQVLDFILNTQLINSDWGMIFGQKFCL